MFKNILADFEKHKEAHKDNLLNEAVEWKKQQEQWRQERLRKQEASRIEIRNILADFLKDPMTRPDHIIWLQSNYSGLEIPTFTDNTPNDTPNDTSGDTTNDTTNDKTNDTPGDTTNDTTNDKTNDTTNDTSGDTSDDTTNDKTNDTTPGHTTNDTTIDKTNDTTNDTPGNTSDDTSDDNPDDTLNDLKRNLSSF